MRSNEMTNAMAVIFSNGKNIGTMVATWTIRPNLVIEFLPQRRFRMWAKARAMSKYLCRLLGIGKHASAEGWSTGSPSENNEIAIAMAEILRDHE